MNEVAYDKQTQSKRSKLYESNDGSLQERRNMDLTSLERRRGQTQRERHGGDCALFKGFLSGKTSRNRDIEILAFDPSIG